MIFKIRNKKPTQSLQRQRRRLKLRLPVSRGQRGQLLLPRQGLRGVGHDPLHLLLDLPRQQQPAVIEHPHLEKAALVIDDDVFAFVHVLKGVWGGGERNPWREQRPQVEGRVGVGWGVCDELMRAFV